MVNKSVTTDGPVDRPRVWKMLAGEHVRPSRLFRIRAFRSIDSLQSQDLLGGLSGFSCVPAAKSVILSAGDRLKVAGNAEVGEGCGCGCDDSLFLVCSSTTAGPPAARGVSIRAVDASDPPDRLAEAERRMRILVTGAVGSIGSAVVDRLRAEGHDGVGIDGLSAAVGGRPMFVSPEACSTFSTRTSADQSGEGGAGIRLHGALK
jgi:hypothetical protein